MFDYAERACSRTKLSESINSDGGAVCGASDLMARVIALKLTTKFGQSVVVENRTGSGGSLGALQVARAPADGYTLLLGSSSEIVQVPSVARNAPYDPQQDFTPITMVATIPLVLTASERISVKSVHQFLDYARQESGKLSYGSAGPGSLTHLAMALLNFRTKITLVHVPYRGSAPVITDLLAGNLQVAMPPISAVLPYVTDGNIKLFECKFGGIAQDSTAAAIVKEVATPCIQGIKLLCSVVADQLLELRHVCTAYGLPHG